MSEEIKSLKNYISTTKNEIFTTFKIETISNLIIYYEDLQQRVEQLEKENKELKEVSGYFSREDLSNGTYTLDCSQYNFQTSITSITGYDASKTQILKNVNGTLTWVDES